MTSRIQELDAVTASQIAAGEVVERPASVIKELCENALDAGASVIEIDIEQGGIRSMTVRDNGEGMDAEDAMKAFLPHATSKLRDMSDLDLLRTMGFRGEALSSIAAVSRVTLVTRREEMDNGVRVVMEGGDLKEQLPAGSAKGSSFVIKDLFYNVPARYKFLKTDRTEGMHITRIVTDLALARPDVSFRLTNDGQERLHSPGNGDLLSTIYAIFGQDTAQEMIEVVPKDGSPVQVSGYIGKPEIARRSRQMQFFMVNQRPVNSGVLAKAVEQAFVGQMMTQKFPVTILNIDVSPSLIDVNVHPQKLEIRFWDEQKVFRETMQQVQSALHRSLGVAVDATPKLEHETAEMPSEDALQASKEAWRKQSLYAWTRDQTKEEGALKEHRSHLPLAEAQSHYESSHVSAQDERSGGDDEDLTESYEETHRAASNEKERSSHEIFDILKHEAKYIGQVFTTYLLFELDHELILIDQHAAHEKLLYEDLIAEFSEDHVLQAQSLLAPMAVRLSPAESELLEEHTEVVKQLGFELDSLGPTSLAIRAIPASRNQMDPVHALRALIDDLHVFDYEIFSRDAAKQRHMLATMACKAAVKGNDRLSDGEVEVLLTRMHQAIDPWRCPHGRPTIIRMPESDLERAFQRIVN